MILDLFRWVNTLIETLEIPLIHKNHTAKSSPIKPLESIFAVYDILPFLVVNFKVYHLS